MPAFENRLGAKNLESVLTQFRKQQPSLKRFCTTTEHLLQSILEAHEVTYHSIQGRVKSAEKLEKKYLRPDKDYKGLDEIKDLVGLRIITYYEDEIDRIAKIVCKEFLDHQQYFIDKRKVEPDRFGYSALHHVCSFSVQRLENTEYKHCEGLQFEIQITTVLGHAWAEMEHEWYDMNEDFSVDIKRRFYRLAALLELADKEFLAIRKEKESRERSVAARSQSGAREI